MLDFVWQFSNAERVQISKRPDDLWLASGVFCFEIAQKNKGTNRSILSMADGQDYRFFVHFQQGCNLKQFPDQGVESRGMWQHPLGLDT